MFALPRVFLVLLLLPFGLGASVALPGEAPPRTFSISPERLVASRAALAAGDTALAPALAGLRADADEALKLAPLSVVQKTGRAASGDPHDYFSYGPYWWPDPEKPDGLPFIRRDGEVNPASRAGTDSINFSKVNRAVETLGLAYYFTGHEPYAAKAAELTRVWYLAPETRMNPHLEYAQAIPGREDGRGIGIIEARWLANLTDGLALIEGSPHWSRADADGLRAWIATYYGWLRTSKNGQAEEIHRNNHGTFYDVQAVHLALYLGRDDDARDLLSRALDRRVRAHIEPDGRQPHELERTSSLSYSYFNLEGLLQLARQAERLGQLRWGFELPGGDDRLLRAVVFLAPYTDESVAWTHGVELKPADRTRIFPLLRQTLRVIDDAGLRAVFETHAARHADARWHLFL